MPIFEFRCRECGETSEILVRSSSADLQCRSCGSGKLEKMLSIPSSLSGVAKSGGCDFQDSPACAQMGGQGAGGCTPGTCCAMNH